MYNLVHKLIDGPLDIVGDIHGEIDALKKLLDTLGYDENGYHPYGRKLIFVGDLVDRGPNSIAVVNMVRNIIVHGNGQCILGNHELNIMMGLQREGNGWFFGSPHDDDHKPFNSVFATEEERSEILAFFKALPLALESDRLRVVHACWDKDAIEKLSDESGRDLITLYNHYEAVTDHYLTHTGISHKYSEEQAEYREAIKDRSKPVPFLPYTAKRNMAAKMFNHIKTLTSGPEKIIDEPYYAGGKWRMLDRDAWWDNYEDDVPVIVGHYWRNFNISKNKHGLFKDIDPTHWFGQKKNIFCIDYSVGRRYVERAQQVPYTTHLMSLRYPENILISENSLHVL